MRDRKAYGLATVTTTGSDGRAGEEERGEDGKLHCDGLVCGLYV